MLRYQIVREAVPNSRMFLPTGEIFEATASDVSEASTQACDHRDALNAADPDGCQYDVSLLGPVN